MFIIIFDNVLLPFMVINYVYKERCENMKKNFKLEIGNMGRNGDGDVSVLLCPVMKNANGFPAINNVCNRSYIFSNCTLLFDKSFFRVSVKKDNVHKCKKTFRKEGTKQII